MNAEVDTDVRHRQGMLVDIVDPTDNVIGTIEKGDALTSGVNFSVVHVFVFNADGLLLVQQIPDGKRHAGLWGSSIAGYVYSGENYEYAAQRRLNEALGIHTLLRFVLKTEMHEGKAIKFISLFEANFSGKLRLNPAEVAAVEWIDMRLIDHLIQSGDFLMQFN